MQKLIIVIASILLISCAGGSNSPTQPSQPIQPIHPTNPVSTSYSGGTQTITYSDGSTQQISATSSSASWASDHVTRTTIYTFPDLTINIDVSVIQPELSFSALPASYPANWTTIGTVTKPSITNYVVSYGDGFVLLSTGLPNDPFDSDLLFDNGINDPNAAVKTANNVVYDLRWGTPDIDGPLFASLFPSGSPSTYSSAITMWGQTVSGQGCASACGATIGAPHPEVIDAWNQGWTGKGVNILMEDWLDDAHGITTTLLASRYAKGSTVYGFDVPTNLGIYSLDGAIASPTSNTNIGVINASFGANIEAIIGHGPPWTDSELSSAVAAYASLSNLHIDRYTGATTYTNFNLTDAVISKAAGNDGLNSNKTPFINALAAKPDIQNRLLVVGALNRTGSTISPATIASYSNNAGTDATVQSRFVVASGTTPFSTGDLAVNGVAVSATSIDSNGRTFGNVGTSYAAPRVAGYVAIVRSKFPNLDAINASSIMLDTARYDTLTCFNTVVGCDKAIYGHGEVSLSRALAPVGRLR
ncbi:MAG: S8 family serine peptidase [Gallionella sp.]